MTLHWLNQCTNLIQLMNTPNSKERFRMMLFLKIVFKLYAETLKQ